MVVGVVLGDGWNGWRWAVGALWLYMMEYDERWCHWLRGVGVVILAPLVYYLIDTLYNIH